MAIQLRQEEQIQCEAHFHWSSYLVSGSWAGLMGLSLLGQLFSSKSTGGLMFWTFILGAGPLAYVWFKNKNKSYVVTNQRLYVEQGILAKSKVDIPFHKINDISFNQGILQRMFGAGNISVMTGNDKPTTLTNLDVPENFREALSSVCHKKAV